MSTLRDLYQRVAAAVDAMPVGVKAEIHAAFADHEAAALTPADPPPPVPTSDPVPGDPT